MYIFCFGFSATPCTTLPTALFHLLLFAYMNAGSFVCLNTSNRKKVNVAMCFDSFIYLFIFSCLLKLNDRKIINKPLCKGV